MADAQMGQRSCGTALLLLLLVAAVAGVTSTTSPSIEMSICSMAVVRDVGEAEARKLEIAEQMNSGAIAVYESSGWWVQVDRPLTEARESVVYRAHLLLPVVNGR
jgi:hypothetical protein